MHPATNEKELEDDLVAGSNRAARFSHSCIRSVSLLYPNLKKINAELANNLEVRNLTYYLPLASLGLSRTNIVHVWATYLHRYQHNIDEQEVCSFSKPMPGVEWPQEPVGDVLASMDYA